MSFEDLDNIKNYSNKNKFLSYFQIRKIKLHRGDCILNIKKWRNISIIFSLILGTILHFLFEWSGENIFVGSFSAVNESIWEHLKLSFFPMLVVAIIGYYLFGKNESNYIKGNSIGIIFSIIFTVATFYIYSGIIGNNFGIINVLIFILSIIFGEIMAYKIVGTEKPADQVTYLLLIMILFICFILFTYFPPKIALFKDPITGGFGI